MKIKQKIIYLGMLLAMVTSTIAVLTPSNVMAKCDDDPKTACCGGVDTGILECKQPGGDAKSAKESGAWGVLLIALNILTAGIGILAVGAIVFAAILYSSSEDEAAQIKKAKDIIKNVIIGLIAYGAMYLLLNFLIPGGIFE